MGRMSVTQELKALARASEGTDAGGCWRKVVFLHRELGRTENALARAAWTMRYGQRGEWRVVLRDAAAQTLREARRAALVYDDSRLRQAAACYARLARCRCADAAALTLKPGERGGRAGSCDPRQHRFEHAAAEVRWTVERPRAERPAKEGRGERTETPPAAAGAGRRVRRRRASRRLHVETGPDRQEPAQPLRGSSFCT
jgi:hypothetical protein